MRCEIIKTTDPKLNLKNEEQLLYSCDTKLPLFLIWQNERAVILGAHQDAEYEVDLSFARENKIEVVKRITGGGAVFHDMGNVNVSLISEDLNGAEEFFINSLTEFFKTLGVDAQFNKRNDIMIGEKKIFGLAKRETESRILIHGCILFDTDLEMLERVLKYHKEKYEGRFIPSVRSRVDNLSNYLKNKITVEEFKQKLYTYYKML